MKMIKDIEKAIYNMRKNALDMALKVGNRGCHIGGGFSSMEILGTLFVGIMNIDSTLAENRDKFILSKGHGTLSYYTALEQKGLITYSQLMSFEDNDGDLPGQPCRNVKLGIEYSSGSLGQGLSLAVGEALSSKLKNRTNRVFVLLGDGECNEGSIWESAISAAHFKLDNLTVIVDKNNLQSDGLNSIVMDMGNMREKWEAFGFHTIEVNGHDIEELMGAYQHISSEKPVAIIANTVKGKGLTFAENAREWHHSRITPEQYELAIKELNTLYKNDLQE